MDWNWLTGMAPFMIAVTAQSDKKLNKVRIVESVVSAIVVGAMSTAAAAWVTLRVVETQTARLISADDERGKQVISILTQMATVQEKLAGVTQQQATYSREMHERLMTLERREAPERNPRAR